MCGASEDEIPKSGDQGVSGIAEGEGNVAQCRCMAKGRREVTKDAKCRFAADIGLPFFDEDKCAWRGWGQRKGTKGLDSAGRAERSKVKNRIRVVADHKLSEAIAKHALAIN